MQLYPYMTLDQLPPLRDEENGRMVQFPNRAIKPLQKQHVHGMIDLVARCKVSGYGWLEEVKGIGLDTNARIRKYIKALGFDASPNEDIQAETFTLVVKNYKDKPNLRGKSVEQIKEYVSHNSNFKAKVFKDGDMTVEHFNIWRKRDVWMDVAVLEIALGI